MAIAVNQVSIEKSRMKRGVTQRKKRNIKDDAGNWLGVGLSTSQSS